MKDTGASLTLSLKTPWKQIEQLKLEETNTGIET